MTDLLQITTTTCFVLTVALVGWLTYDGCIICGVAQDVSEIAWHSRRYVRRKWRQNAATWRAVWRTNKDWGNK